MRSQDPRRWNEEKPCDRSMESDRPHAHERVESGLGARRQVVWPVSVHCGRCRGLMYRIQLRDWGGTRAQDSCDALQCIACGDIIDQVIARNRRCIGQPHAGRRKTREGRPRVAMTF
jgi:hypothetical protein